MMKKFYVVPAQEVIQLTVQHCILAGSANQHRFEVGVSKETMKGADALSQRKNHIWNTESAWK